MHAPSNPRAPQTPLNLIQMITSGERNNLIIWNHNLDFRQTPAYLNRDYRKEAGEPDRRCLSYTHDRDYEAYQDVPKGRKRPERGGWCPPKQFCYDQVRL